MLLSIQPPPNKILRHHTTKTPKILQTQPHMLTKTLTKHIILTRTKPPIIQIKIHTMNQITRSRTNLKKQTLITTLNQTNQLTHKKNTSI